MRLRSGDHGPVDDITGRHQVFLGNRGGAGRSEVFSSRPNVAGAYWLRRLRNRAAVAPRYKERTLKLSSAAIWASRRLGEISTLSPSQRRSVMPVPDIVTATELSVLRHLEHPKDALRKDRVI
jgi:hypothetical protein